MVAQKLCTCGMQQVRSEKKKSDLRTCDNVNNPERVKWPILLPTCASLNELSSDISTLMLYTLGITLYTRRDIELVHGNYIRWWLRKGCARMMESRPYLSNNFDFKLLSLWYNKLPVYLHTCAPYYELLSYKSTMGWIKNHNYTYKYKKSNVFYINQVKFFLWIWIVFQ